MRLAPGLLLVLLAAPRLQAQGSGWTRIGDRMYKTMGLR